MRDVTQGLAKKKIPAAKRKPVTPEAERLVRGAIRKERAAPAPLPPTAWSKLRLHKALTGLKAHDLVTRGVPVVDAQQVMKAFTLIGEDQLYGVLGINPRTMQRRAVSSSKTLDPNASDRALRLVSVTDLAIEVLGSQPAAERWLSSPAMGLDQRQPIDLLQSTEGTEMVKTLLTRMDYGVYA